MGKKVLDAIHPGEILLEAFLKPLGLSQNQVGRDLDVPATRINEVAKGQRPITVDTAMRLARYFGTTADFWLNLQQRYDLVTAERKLGPALNKKIRPLKELAS
jgi:addiction module HigA family antidote